MSGNFDTKKSIYDFNFIDIDGKLVELADFTGKPILMVNTASRCGFTPQYEGLQNLFAKYRKTDLTIIATTSNSFNQEFEDPEDIKKICLVNYNIGFITSSPIEVKGKTSHPIYSWLKNEYKVSPKWNFYKYLFDRSGKLIGSWSSMTKPDSKKVTDNIDNLI
jgi:glutathione peroxidase